MILPYSVTFHADWLIGSGLSDGSRADAALARDADGLPFLPGRAVKGALREGAWRLGLCRADLARCETLFFGSRTQGEGLNQPGNIAVSSARFPGELRALLLRETAEDRKTLITDLTIIRTQTALQDGTARDGSLRAFECGIPGLCFEGKIEVFPKLRMPPDWQLAYLKAVCAAVKSIGAHRSRGFGACAVRVGNSLYREVALPAPLDPSCIEETSCTA